LRSRRARQQRVNGGVERNGGRALSNECHKSNGTYITGTVNRGRIRPRTCYASIDVLRVSARAILNPS
jgi:hypothetical protein